MLTFDYQNAWIAVYQGDAREVAWIKRIFTYMDMSDSRHKQRMGYFPSYCTLDTMGCRISHGQAIHAIRQAKVDGILVTVNDSTQRCLIDYGPIPANILPGSEGRDYQLLAAQIGLLKGHGIITMGTGAGKTFCFGIILKILFERTACGILVLIFSKDLLNQTAKRMIAYGIDAEDIGVIHSDIPPAQQRIAATKRIVLSTHLSITKFDGVIERTQYAVVDECHRAVGPLYSALFGKLPNLTNILGFTATPWDHEGERQKMLAIYGQELVNIPVRFLIDRGLLMDPEVYFIKIYYKDRNIKLANAMEWREAKTQFILEDRVRNLLPIVALKKFGGRMLVIYDDLAHGEHLKSLYEEQGYATMLAEGKTSTKDRDSAVRWFEEDCLPGQHGKVLLASRVFDEGVDISGGCDLFFAIGSGQDTSRVTQRLGRALRKNRSGKLRCFDVQDSNHPILSRWSSKRKGAIEDLKIPVKIISLEDFSELR